MYYNVRNQHLHALTSTELIATETRNSVRWTPFRLYFGEILQMHTCYLKFLLLFEFSAFALFILEIYVI